MDKDKSAVTNLNTLLKEESFIILFQKFCLNEGLNNQEKEYILSYAILFFRFYDLNKRNKIYFKIGYYIILKYALKYKDYRPLYDIRYGKSSLIREFIEKNKPKRIGVIVPTKSLLIQTYTDIKKSNLDYKLVLHDEMYNNDTKFIGILTQERATRILNNNKDAFFDVIFVDEAHNLFKRDSRSYILSRLIQLNYKRNNNQKVVFLSPLVENENNLKIKKSKEGVIYTKRVQHDFKSFELYFFDENKSYFYDRFTGNLIDLKIEKEYFEYILDNSLTKNFVYHNKPKTTEKLAIDLSKLLNIDISINIAIKNIISTLQKEVHPSFYLIDCVSKGVVYIHGKIPNIIKEYIEAKFKEVPELKYIVANKVILEGINLPIDTIFIANNKIGRKNISLNDLLNLIGRANRLNYVFSKESKNLDGLISKIHLLNDKDFQGANSIKSSLFLLNRNKLNDVVENPILDTYNIDNLKFSAITKEKSIEIKEKHHNEDLNLLNFSEFVLNIPETKSDRIKKYFIENSIEQYFDNLNSVIDNVLKNIENYTFNNEHKIVDIIYEILIVDNIQNIKDFEVERLKNKAARKYYNNFIEITQKKHLNQRINSTLKYFEDKIIAEDPYLYIGTGYGEITSREAGKQSKHDGEKKYESDVYINLLETKQDFVNLAIVKLKIEEDFVSYQLTLLIAFLYDFGIIPKDYYYYYIYGTTEEKTINLVRFGLSISIISKLQDDGQVDNLELDRNGNLKSKNEVEFEKYLIKQPELFQFEIRKYLN